jgi:NAD(P)H dehydrogenase (quinone)
MASTPLLVTGAAGQIGRRVLDLLLAAKAGPIIATTRKPEALAEYAAKGVEVRRADFDDEAGLAVAFKGAGRALLISTDKLDRPGARLAQHLAAVRALEKAGVRHVVYTSFVNAEPSSKVLISGDHHATEAALAKSSLDFTILRNNVYLDMLLMALPQAVATGQWFNARGNGAAAFVTREDCARAAAAALAASTTGRTRLDITGPEALTSEQVAAITSRVTGRPVKHVSLPPEALKEGMVKNGLPPPVADLLLSFDAANQAGEFAVVTDAVLKLTGKAPQSVEEFLTAHRSALLPK